MGAFYGRKILNGEINPKTGAAWTIDDVPKFWRKSTQEWLDAHSNVQILQPESGETTD